MWRVLSPANKKFLCFSKRSLASQLVHLAYHLLLCCTLPEWVKGLLHGCSKGCSMTPKLLLIISFFWLLCVQVLEGMLKGASHLRSVLHVMSNLLSTQCDAELLDHFCQELNVPLSLLHLAKQILESGVTMQVCVKQQRNTGTFQP